MDEYQVKKESAAVLLPHQRTYFLPLSYNFNPNREAYSIIGTEAEQSQRGEFNRKLEAEFQISFMVYLVESLFGTGLDLFAGYTHQSWWQVYNVKWSSPFRESNYHPELFLRKLFDQPRPFFGGHFIAYDLGFMHSSNGQIQGLSRSWDRIFLRFAMLFGNTLVKASVWYRVPEFNVNDNPDIHNYLGYGQLEVGQIFEESRLVLRFIPGMKNQGVELEYTKPVQDNLHFFVKFGYGYGLSLIDYNHRSERVGVGVALTDLIAL